MSKNFIGKTRRNESYTRYRKIHTALNYSNVKYDSQTKSISMLVLSDHILQQIEWYQHIKFVIYLQIDELRFQKLRHDCLNWNTSEKPLIFNIVEKKDELWIDIVPSCKNVSVDKSPKWIQQYWTWFRNSIGMQTNPFSLEPIIASIVFFLSRTKYIR